MIKYYLKQAWTMIKQNKLFSFIYILGTALSIALVMIIFIIHYIKFAPIYPEYNRNETLVLKRMTVISDDNNNSSSVSYQFLTNIAPKLTHLKHIAAIYFGYGDNKMIERGAGKDGLSVNSCWVNSGFWNVFTFNFIAGSPFSKADVQSIKRDVVISKYTSEQLFATTQSIGKMLEMNGEEYRVCGVVANVSSATPVTAADIWLPITLQPDAVTNSIPDWYTGGVEYYMLPQEGKKEYLKLEIVRAFDEIDAASENYKHDLMGQPDDYWISTLREWSNIAPDLWEVIKEVGLTLLALILIPAINLSGMISSRMNKRMCELGVRKAYGATRGNLIKQVLWENLLLTCIGGALGLLLSFLIVLTSSNWILSIFNDFVTEGVRTSITPEMIFNPAIFFIAFGVCIVLNLISALIPTLNAMRHTIVYSLNTQK